MQQDATPKNKNKTITAVTVLLSTLDCSLERLSARWVEACFVQEVF
jgi:hypothetical protein